METTQRNISKVRAHDAIVGLLYLASIALATWVDPQWIYLAAGVAVLQIISPLTRFCPVYALLNKMMPDTDPIQHGR